MHALRNGTIARGCLSFENRNRGILKGPGGDLKMDEVSTRDVWDFHLAAGERPREAYSREMKVCTYGEERVAEADSREIRAKYEQLNKFRSALLDSVVETSVRRKRED